MLKLTDFGIAKDTDVTALTGQNSTIGTAAYMSPEQCKGDKNLTNKSDLYSLGIVFFELLTGQKPFYAETTVDMFLKHVNEPAAADRQAGQRTAGEARDAHPATDGEGQGRPARSDAAWVVRMLGEIEEDAFARKSAGLVAATSKRQDQPAEPRRREARRGRPRRGPRAARQEEEEEEEGRGAASASGRG